MPKAFQPDTSSELSAEIFGRVVRPLFSDDIADNPAFAVLARDLIQRLMPRDPIEEMLVAQMLWTHARAARMSRKSFEQKNLGWFKAYATEFERSSNLFRRQMKALTDYRKPRRTYFLHTKPRPALPMSKQENSHAQKSLPLNNPGIAYTEKLCLPEPAVAPEYRPDDDPRQSQEP